MKQSLPPAVTTVALSLRFSSGLHHRQWQIVPKECCIDNSMDVCFTSGSASPLHIAATYGAEVLLPTPPAPKSFSPSDLLDSGDSTLKILCFQKSFLILPCLLPCLLVSSACAILSCVSLLPKAHSQCL